MGWFLRLIYGSSICHTCSSSNCRRTVHPEANLTWDSSKSAWRQQTLVSGEWTAGPRADCAEGRWALESIAQPLARPLAHNIKIQKPEMYSWNPSKMGHKLWWQDIIICQDRMIGSELGVPWVSLGFYKQVTHIYTLLFGPRSHFY